MIYRVTPDVRRKLNSLAKKQGVTVNDIIHAHVCELLGMAGGK